MWVLARLGLWWVIDVCNTGHKKWDSAKFYFRGGGGEGFWATSFVNNNLDWFWIMSSKVIFLIKITSRIIIHSRVILEKSWTVLNVLVSVFKSRKLHKGNYIRTEGSYLIFYSTFSLLQVVSEMNNSNNVWSLTTAKSFSNWRVE